MYEIIGYANGFEVRTAHGADGKFTSGGAVHHGKSHLHGVMEDQTTNPHSKAAHRASWDAWHSGDKAQHSKAVDLHSAAAQHYADRAKQPGVSDGARRGFHALTKQHNKHAAEHRVHA